MRRSAACVGAFVLFPVLATASLPPAGAATAPTYASAIVFVSDRDSAPQQVQDDVYLFDPATGHTSQVTFSETAEQFPKLAPNGRHLAYIDAADGIMYVCALRYDRGDWRCGAPRAVTTNATGGDFTWAPDGRTILYGGLDVDGGDIDVYSVDLFSLAPPKNLTDERREGPPTYDGQPTVSPDGTHVVYGHVTGQQGDLVRRRIDGSSPVTLTSTTTASEFGPEYSPDGQRLLFHSNRRNGTDYDLYTMRPRREGALNTPVDLTRKVRTLSGGPSNERYGSWSPRGRRIAFWWNDVAQDALAYGEVYRMRADGTRVRNVTANNPTSADGQPIGDIMPDWGRARVG